MLYVRTESDAKIKLLVKNICSRVLTVLQVAEADNQV